MNVKNYYTEWKEMEEEGRGKANIDFCLSVDLENWRVLPQ